ncbi:MAG TPA: NADH-quinone oxidoreductase subunit C [Syntrophomonadaceae bacterium]|nr:NADH-quinone oxidoreductase subunit C [Syntrophomonadaceae bacterium]
MSNNDMLEKLSADFREAITIETDGNYDVIRVESDKLHSLCSSLKNNWKFNYLANLSATDFKDRFEVIYHIHSIPDNRKIAVKTVLDREKPSVMTVTDIWRTADWQEREAYDLMGIMFTGHPNLIRILLPYDFEGHPLRKDFVPN